jgi:hypothetical protein
MRTDLFGRGRVAATAFRSVLAIGGIDTPPPLSDARNEFSGTEGGEAGKRIARHHHGASQSALLAAHLLQRTDPRLILKTAGAASMTGSLLTKGTERTAPQIADAIESLASIESAHAGIHRARP